MLASAHRLTRGADYRRVVRTGGRVKARNTITYVADRRTGEEPRFGFIVAKNVGNAVHRNRVRRRLKACCAELTGTAGPHDIVIRALPASVRAEWATLHSEISGSVSKGTTR